MSRILLLMSLLCWNFAVAKGQEADAPAPEEAAAKTQTDGAPAVEAPAAVEASSPAGVAAKEAFDVLHKQWDALLEETRQVRAERAKAEGEARAALDKQAAELHAKADELVEKIVDAGLAVYKADPKSYPEINNTLVFIAQFYLTGGANGDGGDQYEKAIKLVKGLIDAGGGETWPQLYTWGAVAAYCTNDYALAEEYFAKAREAGDNGGTPPSVQEMAANFEQMLPQVRKAWEKEAQIREAEAKADDLPRVKLTTAHGDIVIELFENEAPQAVANFITLVKQGFYDGVVFHRVIPGFMAQGGDPTGTGGGGPGYSIRCECYQPNYRHHFRGSLSMAHAGRNTGGSQFFLTFVPTTMLDGKHTAFGRVIEGLDVMSSIKRRNTDAGGPLGTPDKILKAEVLRDRGHAYEFEKLPER